MKIILLCALASIAAAVPTNLHENLQEHESAVDNLSDTTLREKKAPLHDHHAEAEAETTSSSVHKSSTMEARHFKKPIIVKKKMGYHVYRDSDEEMAHADPHENCREQVKVKLCDEEPGSPKSIGSCLTSELLNEEKEIENSIKTAKEAVENLQRGFHKMENHAGKLTNTEVKEFEDHVAVHQHIEAARKALEQVQQNFDHLDTLHSKPSEEERLAQWKEAMDNIQKNFEIAKNIEDAFKTESEKTNLQSTHLDEPVKIRESDHTESNANSEQNKEEILSNQSEVLKKQRENSDVNMYAAPTEQKELKIKLHSDSLKTEKLSDESVDDHETTSKNTENLMDHVPTMKNSEITPMVGEFMKTEGIMSDEPQETEKLHQHKLKPASDNAIEKENLRTLESNTQDKTPKAEVEDMTPFLKGKSIDDQSNLAKSTKGESLDQTMKHHDMSVGSSNIVTHQSHLEMKNTLNNADDKLTNKGDTFVTKPSITEGQTFDHAMKSKAAQDIDEHRKPMEHMTKIPSPIQEKEDNMPAQMQTNAFNNMRSAQQSHIQSIPTTGFNNGQQNINNHPLKGESPRTIEGQNMAHKLDETPDFHNMNDHSVMQMAEDQDKLHAFLMRWAHENQQLVPESPLTEDFMRSSKMGEFNNGQHIHNEQTGMRSSQDLNTGHHLSENHEHDPHFMQWAEENNQHQTMRNPVTDGQNLHDLFMMRSAEEKQQQDHLKTAPEFHNGHLHEALAQNKFAMVNTQDLSQLGPRMHEHLHIMKHAMPSDMDSSMQPSMHMSMRDAMVKPGFEHNDAHRNHHHHAMARYGSGSGLPISGVGGGGAVGLFPNANTGSCGIPLMLSCSPSVVSGTLAKAQTHPTAITAPAYRSGDDLMYYMKRDAKDTEELPALKIQKSSMPFTHKPELIYDKSQ